MASNITPPSPSNERLTPTATSYNVQLSASETQGQTHVHELTPESAQKISELLMLNHTKYHTFFNEVGLHNHILHQLLTLWALGASASEVQAAYDLNKRYQLTQYVHPPEVSMKLKDPSFFKDCLGKNEFYRDYLLFFQNEIAAQGVEDIVNEYIFKGDDKADDILARMYSGFEHPIIHLGFGLEFKQPCIVAEALSSACVHDKWPEAIIQPVEQYLKKDPNTPSTTLLSVVQSLHDDPVISNAVKPTDPLNRITDALVPRAGKNLVPHLAKWRVKPTKEDIEYRMAEMTHICTYLTGAAQHPKKVPMIEFFMMHSTNLSVFYPTFMRLDWVSNEAKARLLTWKGWMDAAIYAGNGCPDLYLSRIQSYVPKMKGQGWDDIIARVNRYPDDGHTVKLIRALMNAESISKPYLGRSEFPLKETDFLQIAHLAMDSVERMLEPGYELSEKSRKTYMEEFKVDEQVVRIIVRFVRWAGVEGAWDDIPDLEEGQKARL